MGKPDRPVPAIALIDGEHYPDVTADALRYLEEELGYRIKALVFLGGTEKVADLTALSFGDAPVYAGNGQVEDVRRALAEQDVEVVLDMSDEPVVGYRERFRLISEALASGVSYVGADFNFTAPSRPMVCGKPSLGVWGSGKRVGKTAVSGYLARYLSEKGTKTCVLTMGRGGPHEPELLSEPRDVDDRYLRRRVEEGRHAASDHFEDAMMGGVIAVGCRRCGGGMAGEPFYSNVAEGASLACGQDCDMVLFEGSGAAIPPVGVDAALLVVSATQPEDYLLGYLGAYRLLISDLIVVTMCEDSLVSIEKLDRLVDGILSINPEAKVVKTIFRPRPIGDLGGKKVFMASTADRKAVEIQGRYLEEEFGAFLVGTSPHLADRRRLAEDLKRAGGAEVLVTELKAAGVDTVSVFADETGKKLVYVENLPVAVEGDLDREIGDLEDLTRRRFRDRESPGST